MYRFVEKLTTEYFDDFISDKVIEFWGKNFENVFKSEKDFMRTSEIIKKNCVEELNIYFDKYLDKISIEGGIDNIFTEIFEDIYYEFKDQFSVYDTVKFFLGGLMNEEAQRLIEAGILNEHWESI